MKTYEICARQIEEVLKISTPAENYWNLPTTPSILGLTLFFYFIFLLNPYMLMAYARVHNVHIFHDKHRSALSGSPLWCFGVQAANLG